MMKRSCLFILLACVCAQPRGAEVHLHATDQNGNPLRDVVVSAEVLNGAHGAAVPAPTENTPRPTAVIAQADKEFVPYVTAVRVGTSVTFPNHDDVLHNVYSFSRAKTFQLPLYKDTTPDPIVFDSPGVVVLGCNIHDWMVAYVYVLKTPWFAKTDATGQATLALPPGKYIIEAWHPRRNRSASTPPQEVLVRKGDDTSHIPFRLKLKPEWRSRKSRVYE